MNQPKADNFKAKTSVGNPSRQWTLTVFISSGILSFCIFRMWFSYQKTNILHHPSSKISYGAISISVHGLNQPVVTIGLGFSCFWLSHLSSLIKVNPILQRFVTIQTTPWPPGFNEFQPWNRRFNTHDFTSISISPMVGDLYSTKKSVFSKKVWRFFGFKKPYR